MSIDWEQIGIEPKNIIGIGGLDIFRAQVPGGWLLKAPTGGVVFLPDKDQKWSAQHKPSWEQVKESQPITSLSTGSRLYRTPVPDGWIIVASPAVSPAFPLFGFFRAGVTTIMFYPDVEHEWD